MRFDAVVIGAGDVLRVAQDLELLLDVVPGALPGGGFRFDLERGAVEVVPGGDGLRSIRLVGTGRERPTTGFAGLDVELVDAGGGSGAAETAAAAAAAARGGLPSGIDHVVVQSTDPERAIATWRDGLGLRLALDRVFETRGLRLQFFRTRDRVTVEVASPHPPVTGQGGAADRLHGISFRVADLRARHAVLRAAGFDLSEPRDGMKPGTIVCTVRDRTGGVPTLLIQQPARPGGPDGVMS